MIFTYKIFVNGVFKDYVASISESGAKQSWYNVYGSASRYSGIGYDQITAVRVN